MSDDNEIHYEAHQKINEILLKLQELEADGRAEWKSFIPKLTELEASSASHTETKNGLGKLEKAYDQLSNWSVGIDLHIGELEKKYDLILLENVATTTYINRAEKMVKVYQNAYENKREKDSLLKKEIAELKDSRQSHTNMIGTQMDRLTDIKEVLREFFNEEKQNTSCIEFIAFLDGLLEELDSHRDCDGLNKECLKYRLEASGGEKEKVSEGTLVKDRTTLKDAGYDQTDSKLPEPIWCDNCKFNDHGRYKDFPKDSPCKPCIDQSHHEPREDDKENVMFATFDKRTHVVVKREDLKRWKKEFEIIGHPEWEYIEEEYGI